MFCVTLGLVEKELLLLLSRAKLRFVKVVFPSSELFVSLDLDVQEPKFFQTLFLDINF